MSASINPQIEEQQRQQNQYLEALHEVTLGLIENLDLERLLEEIMTHAATLANTTHGFLDVVEPKNGQMQLRTALGNFRENLGVWTKPNQGFSGQVLVSGETMICEDYYEFSGRLAGYEWLHTLICVPLRSGSEVIGVIGLGYDDVVPVPSEHLRFLNQFAHLASLALRNAQLYAITQQELIERKHVEGKLTQFKENLEEVVNERTMEILEANAKLHFEIMDRLRIEEALRASEERYRSLIDNAPMGILSTNRAGSLLSANTVALHTLLDPSMLDQDEINLFEIPFLVDSGLADAMRLCLRSEAPVVTELLFRKAGQEERYYRIHITPILASAETIVALQIILEDITDRKHVETTQQAAFGRLKELNDMKDEFIANISHELRTPITNLKLYHHLMERKPENTTDYLTKLNEQTMRLEHVVEGVLMLSEIKDELQGMHPSAFDFSGLISLLVDEYQPRAGSKGLTIRLDNPVEHRANGDAILVGRVLTILLDNSLSYTPPGGEVKVSVLTDERDGTRWAGVRVSNTGPQIPDEEVPRIFDRFYRGRAALDSRTPGAGLGLATAQEIIQAMNGRIEIKNEDLITAFYVWLPSNVADMPHTSDSTIINLSQ